MSLVKPCSTSIVWSHGVHGSHDGHGGHGTAGDVYEFFILAERPPGGPLDQFVTIAKMQKCKIESAVITASKFRTPLSIETTIVQMNIRRVPRGKPPVLA